MDVREIFPLGSNQWLQVSNITFDTFVTSQKGVIYDKGKSTARKLISSYIEYINDYSSINEKRKVISEKDFEEKYNELSVKWNSLVPDYNKLLKDYQNLVGMNENTKQDIENKNKELELIKKETIQLDNVSFKKLCSALVNYQQFNSLG